MQFNREPGLGSGIEELPVEQSVALRKAIRLEWITIGFLAVSITAVGLVVGQSQAMRTAWFEDMIALVPPIAFLIAVRIIRHPATRAHPYGPHRAFGIAHLVAGVSLFSMGAFLVIESVMALLVQEKPPIGATVIFGHAIWSGWLMMGVLSATVIPMVIIGRIKSKLAKPLHNKVLYADADMAKADWATAVATVIGVAGIGIGLWWMDSVAAIVVASSIVKDGVTNIRSAVSGLSDARATRLDESGPHPLTEEAEEVALGAEWVAEARGRIRDQGHIFHTEIFVVPATGHLPELSEIDALREEIERLDWKLQDVVIAVVSEINPEQVPA